MQQAYGKLMKIQTQLKAPKGQYNNFGKYNYRSCEDIVEAVKPLLNEQKVVIMLSDTVEQIGERHYIKSTVRFIDTETGEEISNTAYAREEDTKKGMDGSQITGASSSYARKYALNGLLCIDDNKDSDSTNAENKENSAKIICQNCNGLVTGEGKLSAAEIAEGTKHSYGKILCMKCGRKAKALKQSQEKPENGEATTHE